MAKNQPAKQLDAAAPVDASASADLVTGELAGDPPAHVAADTPVIDPDALASAGVATVTPIADGPAVSVRVLVACAIGGVACAADDVLEDVPAAVAAAHAGEADSHPDAVAHALSIGAPVKKYAAAE